MLIFRETWLLKPFTIVVDRVGSGDSEFCVGEVELIVKKKEAIEEAKLMVESLATSLGFAPANGGKVEYCLQ